MKLATALGGFQKMSLLCQEKLNVVAVATKVKNQIKILSLQRWCWLKTVIVWLQTNTVFIK